MNAHFLVAASFVMASVLSYSHFIFGIIFLLFADTEAAKLSNNKLLPADGTLCGPGKMGFKFSKSELIDRFKALTESKEPVEVVQIYVTGSKVPEACLYDPNLVEDRKAINVAVTEFEDGERGVNVSASPEVISLGNWIPYFSREKTEPCVTSIKADTVVYFQSEINIEVIIPATQAGSKLRLTIHCEMPRPQSINSDIKVHRVDNIGSAIGEIPFSEFIQLKFVNPVDPTLAVTEVSMDEPVRMVLWKVRQEDRSALRTSIVPIHCEIHGDNSKVAGLTFVQNSCQAKTPAEIITNVFSRRTDVDGFEFREVYWTDFKAFRFDGSSGLLASCTVRICSKSHLSDCQNQLAANGLPCFDEGSPTEMIEYPAITGEGTEDGKPPEQPNSELEFFRLAYPRKYVPAGPQRVRRGIADSEEFVTIKQRLTVTPMVQPTAELQYSETLPRIHSLQVSTSPDVPRRGAKDICFHSYTVYVGLAIMGWLLLFAIVVIASLICYVKRKDQGVVDEKDSVGSVSTSSRGSRASLHNTDHTISRLR